MKNINKKLLPLLLVLTLVFGNLGLSQTAEAKSLKLNKVKLTLQVGDTAKLTVKGVKGKFKWTSKKPKVAKVNKKGKITAKSEGKTVIKVKVKKKVFKCKVIVKAANVITTTTSPSAVATTAATKPANPQGPTPPLKPNDVPVTIPAITTESPQPRIPGDTEIPVETNVPEETVAPLALSEYWAADSANAAKLREYVEKVTDETDEENFIPVKDRIAVFDMDGTLMCETYPTYYDTTMFVNYVLNENPDAMTDEVKTIAQNIEGKTAAEITDYSTEDLAKAFAQAYKGLTPKELYDQTQKFGDNKVSRFNNLCFKDAFYRPMVEVMKYLYENDFTLYVISGTERTTTRAIVANSLIADYVNSNNVIGTEFEVKVKGYEDVELNSTYQYDADSELVFTGNLIQKNLKACKVINIEQEIGKQPVLSFGNSSGDIGMHNYTITGNKYPAEAFMLVADDFEREWGKAENWETLKEKYDGLGFNSVSMANEFVTIYGDDVTIKK